MPEIEWGDYLLDFLWEVGPNMPGGTGPMPLSFSEIESWQRQLGLSLAPWEVRLLRSLSCSYVNEASAATDPKREPPVMSTDVRRLRLAEVDSKLDSFLN